MPSSSIKRAELESIEKNAVLGGEATEPLNARVTSRLKKAVYDASHLTRDAEGMTGIVRKALVFYLQDLAANINSPDPEWVELRDEIWYERANQARERQDRQQELDEENASGVARKLRAMRSRGQYSEMLDYVEQVIADVGELSEGRRVDVMAALKRELIIQDTLDRLDRETTPE